MEFRLFVLPAGIALRVHQPGGVPRFVFRIPSGEGPVHKPLEIRRGILAQATGIVEIKARFVWRLKEIATTLRVARVKLAAIDNMAQSIARNLPTTSSPYVTAVPFVMCR